MGNKDEHMQICDDLNLSSTFLLLGIPWVLETLGCCPDSSPEKAPGKVIPGTSNWVIGAVVTPRF